MKPVDEVLRKIAKQIDTANRYLYKNRIVVLSFILPAFVLFIAYMTRGIFPIFDRNVLIVDLYHQYAPFISDLQDKLSSFSSFLYSWTGGLGSSYLPQFAYYSASPLNILTLLFPKEYLSESILFLICAKAGLAGGFFTLYLKGVHKKQNLAMIAFAMMYGLSGYVMAYSWNIMWLDVVYMLPLIILGLVRLVRDGKGILYTVSLAIALISNFYVAFFACVFTLLYFPVCYAQYHSLKSPVTILKKSAQFGGYSLLGGGLSAILLLPTIAALKLSSAAGDVMPKDIVQYNDLFDYISRHFTMSEPNIRDGMPNMYCGII
ncbi:MAG: YfhO family protein, partial [Eubacteriales bacterium]|nr:YfhO family protein [Eubacteriales bacterium]